jgi:hypothetical protein
MPLKTGWDSILNNTDVIIFYFLQAKKFVQYGTIFTKLPMHFSLGAFGFTKKRTRLLQIRYFFYYKVLHL